MLGPAMGFASQGNSGLAIVQLDYHQAIALPLNGHWHSIE
jgi:hypothetical protein